MNRRKQVLVLAVVLGAAAAAPSVRAEDIGVPRLGFDRVLLDDGRVLDARVGPREGDFVPLTFESGTVRAPRNRVRRVRQWADFDPEPRNEEEKARAAQGCVRWNGIMVPPARAEKLRAEEVEKDRLEREAAAVAGTWGNRSSKGAGKFSVSCNAGKEELDYWSGALAALSKQMMDAFPGTGRWTDVVVYLYRDDAAQREQAKEDAERVRFRSGQASYDSPWDPSRRVDVVLGGRSREELLPQVLCPAAVRLFDEMMGWQAEDLGGWVRYGVPLYFASASFDRGVLRTGQVNDALLFRFREMQAAKTLPPIDDVLQAGNSYWLSGGGLDSFQIYRAEVKVDHVPYSWLLVHFLLHGEGGKHRGALVNWVKFWTTTKIGSKRTEYSMEYKDNRRLLLRYLKLEDFDPLVEDLQAYASGLKYRRAQTHLVLASKATAAGATDSAKAVAHVEDAFALAKGDGVALRLVGEACAAIPGCESRAIQILRASIEVDPLAWEPRASLAKLLSGEERAREGRLASDLRGGAGAAPDGK